jgi:ubiquinone/menaquinone biosynthesis C-methylase UbiE
MKESISFDRAASFYDATRKLNDDLADKITQALLAEIRKSGADRVLEVGIGTGRMARPLMLEGTRMVGVDISSEMMGQLLAQLTPAHTPPELILGDATGLPFRDDSFLAAMVVHVFHLVRSVERTAAELRRVLEPKGVLFHQTRIPDSATHEAWKSHDEFWDRMCAAHGHQRQHRPTDNEVRSALEASGARARIIELATVEHESSVDEELTNLRERKHSWSWLIPDEVVESSWTAFEDWLESRAAPDGTFADRVTYIIEVWQWP